MARCEDYPCCGHEDGECPSRDRRGNLVYRCTCGARLPRDSRSSLCPGCLRRYARREGMGMDNDY